MPSRNMVMLFSFDWICLTVFLKTSYLVNIPELFKWREMEFHIIANGVWKTTQRGLWHRIILATLIKITKASKKLSTPPHVKMLKSQLDISKRKQDMLHEIMCTLFITPLWYYTNSGPRLHKEKFFHLIQNIPIT